MLAPLFDCAVYECFSYQCSVLIIYEGGIGQEYILGTLFAVRICSLYLNEFEYCRQVIPDGWAYVGVRVVSSINFWVDKGLLVLSSEGHNCYVIFKNSTLWTVLGTLESSSVVWSLIPALWMISKSDFINQSLQGASSPVATASFSIHRSSWWSVRYLNLAPSKYMRINIISQTTAWHFLCVVFRSISCAVKFFDQYPISRGIFPTFCFCVITHPTSL